MINMPMAIPTIAKLMAVTFPRYSGARNKEFAPKLFINTPSTVLKSANQNTSKT
jgi:hypothetical protein